MSKTRFFSLVLLLACLAVVAITRQSIAQTSQSVLKSDIAGRYQVEGSGVNIFLVDTQTGRTWLWAKINGPSGESDNPVWLIQERLDTPEQMNVWLKRHSK